MQGGIMVNCRLHRAGKGWVFKKFAVSDGFGDARQLLVNHTACANIGVAHFAVAHLPVRQADIHAGGANISHRAFRHQLVEPGRFRRGDGIAIVGWIVAEAIHNA